LSGKTALIGETHRVTRFSYRRFYEKKCKTQESAKAIRHESDRGEKRVRVKFKDSMIILVPEDADDREQGRDFFGRHAGHVFQIGERNDRSLVLSDLGSRPEACREPINIGSRATDRAIALISNFAATPFELDGRRYASVEGFWQSLRFADASDRARIAALAGVDAKHAGAAVPWGTSLEYEGETIAVGRREHWDLMERACEAKFNQHAAAQRALLATGLRPLQHKTRQDSRSIPGVVMADIWMRVRENLRAQSG
jgi:predicted NAD-dependent protein-ADP-ribosyltransferase YbiA (DUF1768 family)